MTGRSSWPTPWTTLRPDRSRIGLHCVIMMTSLARKRPLTELKSGLISRWVVQCKITVVRLYRMITISYDNMIIISYDNRICSNPAQKCTPLLGTDQETCDGFCITSPPDRTIIAPNYEELLYKYIAIVSDVLPACISNAY